MVVALYNRMSVRGMEDQFTMYMTLVAAAFPFMIAMVTSISFQVEEENNFYHLLSAKNRNIVLLSKLTVLFGMGCFSAVLALILCPLIMKQSYSIILFLRLFMVICIPNVILYMVHGFLFLRLGKTISIFVGICGTLIGFVFLTGLGDRIWKYIPYSMGIRGTNLLILLSTESMENFVQRKPLYLEDISGLDVNCTIEIIIVAVLLMLWFCHWEGRKVYE